MKIRRLRVATIFASWTLCMTAIPAAHSQTTTDQTTPDSVGASKQTQKAERKADRKAHRAKERDELKDLKKHGYNQAEDEVNYPQSLQNAEKKVDADKQRVKPVKAP
jgi:aspartyl/asparaginyl beta-hydroxylase (cupin superfamily)